LSWGEDIFAGSSGFSKLIRPSAISAFSAVKKDLRMEHRDSLIRQVADWIRTSKKVIVFTGAGVSTESGIPDFRSPGGVWQKYNPEDFYYQKFISSEASREKYWQMSREFYEPLKNAEPNEAHRAIAQ